MEAAQWQFREAELFARNRRDGDNNVKMLIGVILGLGAAWLYSSGRARHEFRRQFLTAPESLEQLATAASAAATGVQRVSEAIDSAPLSDRAQGIATGAAVAARAATDALEQPGAGLAYGGEVQAESHSTGFSTTNVAPKFEDGASTVARARQPRPRRQPGVTHRRGSRVKERPDNQVDGIDELKR
jgi:hypothetical protein